MSMCVCSERMTKTEVQRIVKQRLCELGASQMELQSSGVCWVLKGNFVKVTTLSDWWVLEWTDNYDYAFNDCFEDVDPMPYCITELDIIKQVDNLLIK